MAHCPAKGRRPRHRRPRTDSQRRGYWLVGADGSVYAFGDAVLHGSEAGQPSPPRSRRRGDHGRRRLLAGGRRRRCLRLRRRSLRRIGRGSALAARWSASPDPDGLGTGSPRGMADRSSSVTPPTSGTRPVSTSTRRSPTKGTDGCPAPDRRRCPRPVWTGCFEGSIVSMQPRHDNRALEPVGAGPPVC